MTNEQASFEDILDLCIERLRNGESKESILSSYPEYMNQLEAHLHLSESYDKFTRVEPDKSAIHKTIFAMGAASSEKRTRRSFLLRLQPSLAWAASLILVFIFAGYSAVSFADNSMPGDFLYPLKLATEKIRLVLTSTPEGEIELRITLSEKRLREVVALARKGNIDSMIINAMLSETKIALESLEQLPASRKEIVKTKLGYFSGYQSNILTNLLNVVPEDDGEVLSGAIKTCSERFLECCRIDRVQNNHNEETQENENTTNHTICPFVKTR
ncbi:MAG: hypothetical protein HQ591_10430 [candidate division Zixibacteria bacterium]|nr:hypothetical protein [Candidatus Tariuqbacter arcticus]